jgi:hypothetical protein
LRAVRIVREADSLKAEDVSYRVRSVTVGGDRAPGSSDPFVPSANAQWTIAAEASSNLLGQIAVVVVALLLLIGGFFILRIRRGSRTAIAPSRARFRTLIRKRNGPSQPFGKEYVRVKLKNGRTVEGWKIQVPGVKDSEAIHISVTQVCGPDGETVEPGPLDSFVLSSQIVQLEVREEQPQVLS